MSIYQYEYKYLDFIVQLCSRLESKIHPEQQRALKNPHYIRSPPNRILLVLPLHMLKNTVAFDGNGYKWAENEFPSFARLWQRTRLMQSFNSFRRNVVRAKVANFG